MTDKERAFLDEIQAVCKKHKVIIKERSYDWDSYDYSFTGDNISILITEDLLEE